MPFITIDTNAKAKVSQEVMVDLAQKCAEILHKPIEVMIVKINTGVNMIFGGDETAIGALMEVKSVGYGESKAKLVAELTRFAMQEFNAEQKYVSMHLVDMPAANVGENGVLKA